MKNITQFLFLITLIFIASCSKDDEVSYNFSGVWKLERVSIITSSIYNSDFKIETEIFPDEKCLVNNLLTINQNGSAVINSDSNIEVSLKLIEGSNDEFAHKINCTLKEYELEYTWLTGGYSVNSSDGTTVSQNTPGLSHLIRFLDGNKQVALTGMGSLGSETNLILFNNFSHENFQLLEFEGEEIKIHETRLYYYVKI